jgi:FkbM family methyltransferase
METINLPRTVRWLQGIDFQHKLGICEKLFGKGLNSYGICWTQTAAGIPWKLDLTNPTHRWIVYGKYEGSPFLNWARAFLPDDGIVVDSGANIGQMLLYLAQWVPRGRVLAFEPGREQAEWLSECLRLHAGLPVELIRCGLGASPHQVFLHNPGPEQTHGAWNQISEEDGEPIEITRLDDELSLRSIHRVDLWKLDVEGYEVFALQGASELLKEHLIKALYVELSGANGSRIQDYLAAFGYRCYLFDSRGRLRSDRPLPSHTNGLFLPV